MLAEIGTPLIGKKSDRRRVWHFMERGRRPRKRRDPEPRRDRQTGNQKKMRSAMFVWKKGIARLKFARLVDDAEDELAPQSFEHLR